MDKIGLTKQVKARLLKRLIIVSWISLLICVVIKLAGFDVFNAICKNKRIISICNYVDNNLFIRSCIGSITSLIGLFLMYLSMLGKLNFNKKEWIIFVPTVICCSFIKFYTKLELVADIVECFILPMIFIGKKYWRYINTLIVNLANIVFQLISMYIKDVRYRVFDDNTLISLTLLIDMYVMLLLYYLYINLRGGKIMGGFFTWFFCNNVSKLENFRAKDELRISKLDPVKDTDEINNLKEEIGLINEKIAKIKN